MEFVNETSSESDTTAKKDDGKHTLAADKPQKCCNSVTMTEISQTHGESTASSQHRLCFCENDAAAAELAQKEMPRKLSIVLAATMVAIPFASSMSNGLVVVGTPVLASDINLPESLYLW